MISRQKKKKEKKKKTLGNNELNNYTNFPFFSVKAPTADFMIKSVSFLSSHNQEMKL